MSLSQRRDFGRGEEEEILTYWFGGRKQGRQKAGAVVAFELHLEEDGVEAG